MLWSVAFDTEQVAPLSPVSMPATGAAWAGTVRLAAPSLHRGGGGGGGNLRVCRFQYPVTNGVTANQRNVQPYAQVAESLDSQNYVITGAAACPEVDGLVTTEHQVCTSSNASRATDCPAS